MAVRYIRSGDVSLALETRGHGPRGLLFAHGWISSRRMWYELAAHLDETAFTLHLLDFRGCGTSDRPAEGHDLAGYASDLRAALDSIAGPVTLIGHSMGGKVAQFVALERPANVRDLVLVAPGTAAAHATSPGHRATAFAAFGSRVRIARFVRGAMRHDVAPHVFERLVDDALLAQREHWFGWYDDGRGADFSAELHRLELPTVIVAGDNDPLAPARLLRREVADRIPGALFVTFKGCGHNLPVEAPAPLAQLLGRLL